MNEMKISVIIPVYNAEKHLKECLESIIQQSLKEIEIICIDDASTDDSLEIVKDFSKKDKRIKYFKLPKNSGAGPARNKGLKHAKGKYISFVDSDDFIITKDAYKKLYDTAIKQNAKIISANLKTYFKNGKIEKSSFIEYIEKESKMLPQEYGIPWYFQKNLYKKQFLKENHIKFPKYSRGQDPVFLAKTLVNSDFVYCLPIDFYMYRTPLSTKINTEKKEKEYINHFKDVFEILKEPKFEKTRLEYEEIMHKFFIDHTFIFPSKSLEKNVKNILGGYNKTLTIYKLNCSLWKKDDKIRTLNKILSKKENTIQEKENTIQEKENTIQEKENTIQEKENTIQEKENTIQEKENTIQEKENTIQEKENTIQTIMFSNSWKLTKPFRNFGTMLRNIK